MAAADLARAAEVAARCAALHGNMAAAWKLAGDAQLQHHAVTPLGAHKAEPADRFASLCLASGLTSRTRSPSGRRLPGTQGGVAQLHDGCTRASRRNLRCMQ